MENELFPPRKPFWHNKAITQAEKNTNLSGGVDRQRHDSTLEIAHRNGYPMVQMDGNDFFFQFEFELDKLSS